MLHDERNGASTRDMLYCPLANWLPKPGAKWRIDCVCVYTGSLPVQFHPAENHLQVQVAFHHTWVYLRISFLPPPPPALPRWYQGQVWFSFCFLSLSELISLQERRYLRLLLCMGYFIWYSFKMFLKEPHYIMVCFTVKKKRKRKIKEAV